MARLIERTSVTYPAQDVKQWFADADFVHVSNEISFKPDCVPAPTGSVSFCAHDRYIELLEEIGTNVVELTGNHLGDKGREWIIHTLEMYRERGWGGMAAVKTSLMLRALSPLRTTATASPLSDVIPVA